METHVPILETPKPTKVVVFASRREWMSHRKMPYNLQMG
jgi:hypothetical protein